MTAPINLNNNVQIDPYNGADASQATLVAKYVAFAPDIIVLAGTAEAVTKLMQPIEAAWTAPDRPSYVLIDSNPEAVRVMRERLAEGSALGAPVSSARSRV